MCVCVCTCASIDSSLIDSFCSWYLSFGTDPPASAPPAAMLAMLAAAADAPIIGEAVGISDTRNPGVLGGATTTVVPVRTR